MPRWLRKLLLNWMARVVFLRKTVERSCPKPNKRKTMRKKVEKNAPGARQNGSVAQISLGESTPEKKDDRLIEELKSVFIISKNLDYGGLRYVNSIKTSELNGDGSENMTSSPDYDEPRDEGNLPFTGVLDENGEELGETELALRQWEWVMAARVLDRALLWVSVVMGVVTGVAIFMRAPRLQCILFGS